MKNLLNQNGVQIAIDKNEPRISHKVIAEALGVANRSQYRTITEHQSDFEEFGKVRFENAPLPSGQSERIAYLNEDQCYLLLTYSRNTAKVRKAKIQLVKAFRAARDLVRQRKGLYLPMYHHAHDAISNMAKRASEAGSTTAEEILHMNYEKLINKILGVDSGNRDKLNPEQLAFVTQAHSIIGNVLRTGVEAKQAYIIVKGRLNQLAAITAHSLEVAA